MKGRPEVLLCALTGGESSIPLAEDGHSCPFVILLINVKVLFC